CRAFLQWNASETETPKAFPPGVDRRPDLAPELRSIAIRPAWPVPVGARPAFYCVARRGIEAPPDTRSSSARYSCERGSDRAAGSPGDVSSERTSAQRPICG